MACYYPIPASQDHAGARVVLYPPGHVGDPTLVNLELPCGSCIGCFSSRALEWARRCSHEAAMWSYNSFVTLTYDEEHLPFGGILEPYELSKFLKRLRKFASTHSSMIYLDSGYGIRFFAIGEYGEHYLRPHYHVLLFNCGFVDARFCGKSKRGDDLYESPCLSKLWSYGSHKIGLVTAASANYVAQYSLKNVGLDYGDRPKPFVRMSLKPAIGAHWVDSYKGDLRHGYMVVDGHKVKVPRAYLKRLSKVDGAYGESVRYEAFKASRRLRGESDTPAARAAAEVMHLRKLELRGSVL